MDMAYYKRLKEMREDHDLKQHQLAAFLQITQPQYSRYELGYRDIPLDLLIRIADFYHTSTDYLLERTDDPGSDWPVPDLPKPPRL